MKKILIVEDDKALLKALTATLEAEDFNVISATDGKEGFQLACQEKIDLIILDLVVPSLGGFEICQRLREKNIMTPIIFLTGKKKEEIDRVLGLEIGADDYLLKPFGTKELLARIRAVLRRFKLEPAEIEEYSFGDVFINFKKQIASKGDKELYLTAKEFGLLRLLILHESEVVSRETILNEVWGYDKFPTTRTIDTFIHHLRQKIEDNPANPEYLITIPWSGYKFQGSEAEAISKTQWENSIAILPFMDLSTEKDQEYFCDGMAEDIITKLSRIETLKVISQASMMRYKKTEKGIKRIGKELGVTTILEGSIRKEKDNIRVSAKLINVEDGSYLWADNYDRKLDRIFEVQDEVSKAIADALKLKLTPDTLDAFKTIRPKNIEAYEYYLKGMHFINSKYVILGREEDFKNAIRMFQKANEIESNYSLTYIGLTWAYQHHYQITGNKRNLNQVIENGEKAYKVNPNLVETNSAIAWVFYLRREYDKAYQSYKKALEINPNIPSLNHLIGLFYRNFGLLRQAIEYTSSNIELDPFYIPSHSLRARCFIYTGELEKAEISIEKASEIEPNNFWSFQDYSLLFIMRKKIEKAKEFLARAERINPGYPGIRFYKALILATKGEKNKALALKKNGAVYSILGMKDEAIKYINDEIKKGYEHYQYTYLPLKNNTFYDRLRDDARFKEIVKKQKKKYEERLKKYGKM